MFFPDSTKLIFMKDNAAERYPSCDQGDAKKAANEAALAAKV